MPNQILWTPKNKHSNMSVFRKQLEDELSLSFPSYSELYDWSVLNPELFWKSWASHSGFKFISEPTVSLEVGKYFWESVWMPGATYNFAENLLKGGDPSDTAIVFYSEDGIKTILSYAELSKYVLTLKKHLEELGVGKGDRVCGIVPNSPIATIAMLATTALGAIWASASPDFGVKAILDRFEQIQPKVLVSVTTYLFKGKSISILDKVEEISNRLAETADFKQSILFDFNEKIKNVGRTKLPFRFSELSLIDGDIKFEPITFSDPVYIMFSSGTTGLPKCIVQGGGVLLNHTKELGLHCNLSKGQKLFYYTTCGWMMWNWSQSILALGGTLYQFDGNPFYPSWEVLWKFADEESIDVFGTSAKYLSVLMEDGADIKSKYNLSNLKVILSTGSPLPKNGFRYVYDHIKEDVQLSSISGGTDLNGCFGLGNPDLPVVEGEIQCRGLGMDVQVFDEEGKSVIGEKGELVCLKPFPSMPLYFWNDVDKSKYKSAYFSAYENVWCHGDFISISENGGLVIYGRSDATLNPGGVRIGTADIYSVLQTVTEVKDSVIIGQNYKDDIRVVLFVVLAPDHKLDQDLILRIKTKIKNETSPRHVPSIVLEVPEIPYTVNGKKVELAVKQTVEGEEVKNKNVLANPGSIEYFKQFPELYS
ncbi:acetoacetate--CoA ligase [Leptospira sp. 96542]|nr:acetoacetate--CoA ligase [Leptospira sp. 96542]